jgi:sulfite reductase beta subunit-like hemoprotein
MESVETTIVQNSPLPALNTLHLAPEVRAEIERFQREIERLATGELEADDFKRFRLSNGVYGIRGSQDLHMVRVKIPFGAITPDQLEALAEVAEEFTPNRVVHVTTRQDFQFHYIKRRDIPRALLHLANSGLTTREACGNTVRNVTACPFAGISPTEAFDVTPYANALSRHLLRNPINQNLPRKFKIAFEGCADDHARTPIHDFGCVAALREVSSQVERGFRIYIGGGLGSQPKSAELLEPFTPADLLIPTAEAVIRVFDRHGERRPEHTHRMRARLKFLIQAWGFEKLRREFLIERRAVLATRSGLSEYHIEPVEETPPQLASPLPPPSDWQPTREYERWLKTNVIAQKQVGWYSVMIRCPLGDLSATHLRKVASIGRRYAAGRIRATISQNLLLRWVAEDSLPWVYQELRLAGLALSEAHRIADITRCPGADTCQLAITHSRGLAEVLGPLFSNGYAEEPAFQNISIKISGCMNSCGQHHIADIGFYGVAIEIGGHQVPSYTMLLGGRTREGQARFGKAVAKVPARLIPDAARKLLNFYRDHRQPEESFAEFVDRTDVNLIRRLLNEFTKVPDRSLAPELYQDLGAEQAEFKLEVGLGECAS